MAFGVALGFGGGGLGTGNPKVGGALSALGIFPATSLIRLLYSLSMFGMSACGAS